MPRLDRHGSTLEVAIRVDLHTGAVLRAEVVSGHPLLKPAVLKAAEAWRFEPEQHRDGVRSERVKVLFKLNCPPKSTDEQSTH
jgi:outer membrane biosynthesis protein TonB